ncbi:hypothetical protein [Streptomyces rubrogriseus]|uniref:hypothetical protein n=1 Tax=Streptomyces rubrogriseus TaxID=194673 RepID=UPI000D59241E|nr:hypothetical protein [Streptomyces rubrogriseus]
MIWALRMVEDLAEDILAAAAERLRMSTIAGTNAATPAGLVMLRAFLERIVTEQQPFPSIWNGEHRAATTYVAALTAASRQQVGGLLGREGWAAYIRRHPGPCPLDITIAGRIDNRPWRQVIDFGEVATLLRHLATACFVVVAYLTGMRPGGNGAELQLMQHSAGSVLEEAGARGERTGGWFATEAPLGR